jgi:hypothetical protein
MLEFANKIFQKSTPPSVELLKMPEMHNLQVEIIIFIDIVHPQV